MKCNVNNTMAKAYGEDFNLSTEEIINTIEKIYKLESIDTNFRHEDVEVALYNYDYYIRPGKDKAQFMKKCQEIFKEIQKDLRDKPEWLVHWRFSVETMKLIKESFDEVYFKEQIARRQKEISTVGKSNLSSYLKKFDEKQLKTFICIMIACRHQHGLFISEPSSAALWKTVADKCRELGCDVPMAFDTKAGEEFLSRDPFYFFKWLDKKTIAAKLCDAIDLDVSLAGSVAKKFYNCGEEATLNYLNIKLKERTSA